MDIILALVQPLAEWAARPIRRQLSYVFHYKSNIEHLNEQFLLLREKREGVDLGVTNARRALQRIDGGVGRWLDEVHTVLEEKDKESCFSEKNVAAKAACCNGWLPNIKCRYSSGRKAKKMTAKVDNLLANEPRAIAHPAAPPLVEFKPTEHSTLLGTNFHEGASSSAGTSTQEQPPASEAMNINFDSRRSTIRDVMEALKGKRFNPIIICGMGGIGKTTLMGQVFEKAKEEGLFDEYTKATLSLDKAPDVIQIQDELAQYLGLPLEGKESGRANKLRERLSQGSKKILVMLDNVSTTTRDFLWDIGIPLSCKLLVTSRQQDLFKDMDTRKNFPIHGLPDPDAWSLFKKTAGSSIESDRELEAVAKEVLKECAGLPIAISTVGTALKGENIAVWKNAQSELKKANPENVPGVIEHVYGKIKFSYECLPSKEAKSCFLLCCIFEESADIKIEDLVRYGLGLMLFEGIDSMVEGRNRMETLVQILKSRFFFLESDKKECVRMHDVVRDVAVHIASEEFVEKKNDGVEKRIVMRDKAETVKLMDWPNDSGSERSIYCSSLSISGLCQLLLLRTLSTDKLPLEPPSTIFNRMEDLKVLAIIQKRSILHRVFRMHLLSLVPSLAVLKNLQTLRLEGCDLECDVSVIGELRTLMILSLRESNIKQLPDTFKNLSNLRLLDLSKCGKLQIIPPGMISSLSRLEELFMSESFYNWVSDKLVSTETTNWISQLVAEERAGSEEVDKWKRINTLAVEQLANQEVINGLVEECEERRRWAKSMDWTSGILSELLSLSGLTRLTVFLPPLDILLTTDVLGKKLERFQISLGWTNPSTFEVPPPSENYLRVFDLDASSLVGSKISWLLNKTNKFVLSMKNLTDPLNVFDFANLNCLELYGCDALEYLIDVTRVNHATPRSTVFPVLESLRVGGATRLKEICHGELLHTKIPVLRSLVAMSIGGCHSLRTLLSPSIARGLVKLQRLEIGNCEKIEEIVAAAEGDEETEDDNIFPQLTELSLQNLPNLRTLLSPSIARGLVKLQRLKIGNCKKIEEIVAAAEGDEETEDDNIFPQLTELSLQNLPNLRTLLSPSIARGLVKLKALCIFGCEKIEEIVAAAEGDEETEDDNIFPQLTELSLQNLPNLRTLLSPSIARGLVKLQRLKIGNCKKIEEIVAAAEGDEETEDHNIFPQLAELSLQNLPNLRTLLSPSIARGLVKLQRLKIGNCKKIEEIVAAAEGDEETEDHNIFPQLTVLYLQNLPNLRSFSQGKCNFKWPLVKFIRISGCCNMKKFCFGSVSIPWEVRLDVSDVGENVLQELNNSRKEK